MRTKILQIDGGVGGESSLRHRPNFQMPFNGNGNVSDTLKKKQKQKKAAKARAPLSDRAKTYTVS